jgi:hypothetical protein
MREEMRAARQGLSGHIRIAAIPTALAMVPRLTHAFREKHPASPSPSFAHLDRDPVAARQSRDRRRHHLSRQRAAGARRRACRCYSEHYQLITAAGGPICRARRA